VQEQEKAMKVIRNGIGWDIAFDMAFTDKATATIIAQRIAPLLATLVRDAVDASMCEHLAATQDTSVNVSASALETAGQGLYTQARLTHRPCDVAPAIYATHSITSRVRAMGL
jgi:hypothetical protein